MKSLVVLLVAATAYAEPPMAIAREPKTSWNLLGTRIMFGTIEIEDTTMATMSIGVSIDHPVIGAWRVLGEYEYIWLGTPDAAMDIGVAGLPESGQRVLAGLRRRVEEHWWAGGRVGVWIDAEAGGGAMMVDHRADTIALPHAFAGVRAGLSLHWDNQLWDYELVVRGLAMQDGPGFVAGIGLVWGD